MLKPAQITRLRNMLKAGNESLVDTFAVLGDKTRYKIVELLSQNDKLCVTDLALVLELSLSCISQHLRILEMSGLVESKRSGKTVCYRFREQNKEIKNVIELMQS